MKNCIKIFISKFKKTKSKKTKDKNNKVLFPLYPIENLNAEDSSKNKSLKEYFDYLDKAFDDKNIKNIAVTGDLGIGKSSIIRSFDKRKNKKKVFLYVSLGNFSEKDKKYKKVKIGDDLNSLERRLLMQVYSRFEKSKIPFSSFSNILNHKSLTFILFEISIVITVFTILFLITLLYDKTNAVVDKIFSSGKLDNIKLVSLLLLIVSGTYSICYFLKSVLPKFNIGKIELETKVAEVKYENDSIESFLDKYASDMVYCLNSVKRKIDYTVVFEDMDRLNYDKCVEIFVRLREINALLNSKIEHSHDKKLKPVRFIYCANNSITNMLESEKFFDYILSVYPTLNNLSSDKILKEKIEETGIEINNGDLIELLSRYLTDYRTMNNILNEFMQMYWISSSLNSDKSFDNNQLLAFSVYKNLFCDDYIKIKTGKSAVLPEKNEEKLNKYCEQNKLGELLKEMCNRELLDIEVLYQLGYSKKDINDYYTAWVQGLDSIDKVIDALLWLNKKEIKIIKTGWSIEKYAQAIYKRFQGDSDQIKTFFNNISNTYENSAFELCWDYYELNGKTMETNVFDVFVIGTIRYIGEASFIMCDGERINLNLIRNGEYLED